jgi:hypothetical protein
LDGTFYSDAQWNTEFIQPYIEAMKDTLGKKLNTQLTTCDSSLTGGNANCNVSAGQEKAYTDKNNCDPSGTETRCSGPGYSLHFHIDKKDGQLKVHMDSANPGSWSGPVRTGVAEHFFVDVLGGHTIFNSGVPH